MKRAHVAFGLAVVGTCVCGVLRAAEFTWVPGSTDWFSKASYVDENAVTPVADLPQDGDVLKVTTENASLSIDDDSIAFVSRFHEIKPALGVTITVDVSTNAVLGCYVNKTAEGIRGTLVKAGTGTLTLRDSSNPAASGHYDYYCHFKLEAGTLVLPHSINPYNHFWCGSVDVDHDATLFLAMPGNLRCTRLNGSGLITNNVGVSTTQLQPQPSGFQDEFSGRLMGAFRYYANAWMHLTGIENTLSRDAGTYSYNGRNTGILGFAKIGNSGEPSSHGKNSEIRYSSEGESCYLYLGTGETTNKKLVFQSKATYTQPQTFDAGAMGGIVFNGEWIHSAGASQMRLQLKGSNTVPCRICGKITGYTSGGTNYSWYVTKSGTGTWSFESANAQLRGPLSVEDGMVQFTTLDEKGKASSLGDSTELWADAYGPQTTPVDYAFQLGATGTSGAFSHFGSNTVICTTRPVELRGAGGMLSADGTADFRMSGISAQAAGETTLALAGTNGTPWNTAWSVTDGSGRVSVVKKGTNTWTLAGEQSFSGDLTVEAGTLVVDNCSGKPFNWFRFLVKETAQTCPRYDVSALNFSGCVQFSTVRMVDATGSLHLANASAAFDDTAIPPGSVGYGYDRARPTTINHSVAGAFTNDWVDVRGGNPILSNTNSWRSFVFHLTNGAPEIVGFNYKTRFGTSSQYWSCTPTAFAFEGSVDGVHWTELVSNDAWEIPSGEAWASGSTTPLAFKQRAVNETMNVLENVAAVRVAAGATLRREGMQTTISSLRVDANGAGTLDGFTFAANGTIDVLNAPKGETLELPGTYVNAVGLDNLSNWNVKLNGVVSSGSHVSARNGKLYLYSQGTVILIE